MKRVLAGCALVVALVLVFPASQIEVRITNSSCQKLAP